MFAQLRFWPFFTRDNLVFSRLFARNRPRIPWVGEYILPTKPTKEIKFGGEM